MVLNARSVHPWVAASHFRWFMSDFVIKRVLWLLTGTSAGCVPLLLFFPPFTSRGQADVDLVLAAATSGSASSRPSVSVAPTSSSTSHTRRRRSSTARTARAPSSCRTCPSTTTRPRTLRRPASSRWRPGRPGSARTARCSGTGRRAARRAAAGRRSRSACRTGESSPSASLPPARPRSSRLCAELTSPSRSPSRSLVLFASGYKQEFSSWLSDEYPRPWDADVRDVVSSDAPDVAFLGFVRPGVGAIPPIAEQQSMWWTAYLQGKMQLPTDRPHYYLLSQPEARIQVRPSSLFLVHLVENMLTFSPRSCSTASTTRRTCRPLPRTWAPHPRSGSSCASTGSSSRSSTASAPRSRRTTASSARSGRPRRPRSSAPRSGIPCSAAA